MPQDDPNIVPRALLAALGRSWTALGPLLAALGRSWLALGASWADLGASWADLGPSWGDLGASMGDLGAILGAQERGSTLKGVGGRTEQGGPPRDYGVVFFEMFENPKGCSTRDVHEGFTTRRAALGAADLERPAGETPPPPRRDVPRARCGRQLLQRCVTRWYQKLFGNSWGCLWDADDSSWDA